MSYCEGLPIYRAAMDVTVKVDRVVQRFRTATRFEPLGASPSPKEPA